jgi:hypothetical protein
MSDRQLNPIAKELIAAKKLIQDPDNWCQRHPRRGNKFCARGALDEVGASFKAWDLLAGACLPICGYHSVIVCNDSKGHAAIMQAFDLAISKALSQSPEE